MSARPRNRSYLRWYPGSFWSHHSAAWAGYAICKVANYAFDTGPMTDRLALGWFGIAAVHVWVAWYLRREVRR